MISDRSKRSISRRRIKGRTFSHPIRAKEANAKRRVLRLLFILFLTSLGCGGFLFIQEPIAEINELQIDGIATIPNHMIYGETIDYLNSKKRGIPNRKRYVFNAENLESYLMNSFPIEAVKITHHKAQLHIQITEQVTNIAWKAGEKWYLLNMDGEVVREAQADERVFLSTLEAGDSVNHLNITHLQPFIPLLIDLSNTEVSIGENVLLPLNPASILLTTSLLKQQSINPRYFLFESQNAPWLTVVTNEPYHIRLDGEGDIVSQLSRLSIALREYVNADSISYIDLRFGDHVFVKER